MKRSLMHKLERSLDTHALNGKYVSDGINITLSCRNHSQYEIERFQEDLDALGFYWEIDEESHLISIYAYHDMLMAV